MQITMEELADTIIHAYLKGQRDLEKAIDNITKSVDAVDKSLDAVTDSLKSFKNNPEPHKYEPLSSSKSNICKWCNNPWSSKIHGSFGGEPVPDQAVVEVEDKPHKYEPINPDNTSSACKFCDHGWSAVIHTGVNKPRDHAFKKSGTLTSRCTVCGQPYNSLKHLSAGTVGCKSMHEYHPCVLAMGHNEDHFYDMAVQIGYTERR